MKLTDFLPAERIRLDVVCRDWKTAIQAGCDPLLRDGVIQPEYAAAIMRHHEEMGPYMVIAPGIMFAHARPEEGGRSVGISLIRLRDAIAFGNETNDPVRLVITLATPDHEVHLSLLEKLMELLTNEEDMREILRAESVERIAKIMNSYD